MRSWLTFLTGLTALGAIVALFVAHRPVVDMLAVLAVAGCAAWALIVLTLPWNLHFQAAEVVRQLDRSLERGLEPGVNRAELVRIAGRTRALALGAHVLSAAAVALIAWRIGWAPGAWIAGAFLVSSGFRPVGSWYLHLRERLRLSMAEVHFPRNDVLAVQQKLAVVASRVDALGDLFERLDASHAALEVASRAADRDLELRLERVGRKFEEAIEHLTDDRELLAGLRAFLKLIRASAP